jgi:hypothetical protein
MKISNTNKKFSKILANQMEQVETRVSGMEDKVEKSNKEKKWKMQQNIQDLWSAIQRPKLQIIGTEE